ncbi:MAG: tetraacyldisaccharide 4'-kinase [Rhizobiales bacterium]|nr:tetraacyldisaccharide 4'-kinase [Hyphomicrobiales bacterium]
MTERCSRRVATKVFADHHPFSESDARELIEQANQVGALLATTEKDAVRLRGAGGAARAQLAERTTALPVTLSVDDEENFARLLRERLRPRA